MKKLSKRILTVVAVVAVLALAGSGWEFKYYSDRQDAKSKELETSFMVYANSLVSANGGTNLVKGKSEVITKVYTREFQFTGSDGTVYGIVAMEVGSHWTTLTGGIVSKPVAPTTAPSTSNP